MPRRGDANDDDDDDDMIIEVVVLDAAMAMILAGLYFRPSIRIVGD